MDEKVKVYLNSPPVDRPDVYISNRGQRILHLVVRSGNWINPYYQGLGTLDEVFRECSYLYSMGLICWNGNEEKLKIGKIE
jgi:hypothetical protein